MKNMSKSFIIKKYWISTLCLLFFLLTAVAQQYSDQRMGFNVSQISSTLKKLEVKEQDRGREITIRRHMHARHYLATQKIKTKFPEENASVKSDKITMNHSLGVGAKTTDIAQRENDVLKLLYAKSTGKDLEYSDSEDYNFVAKQPLLTAVAPVQQPVLENGPTLLNELCSPQTTGSLNITSEDFLIGRSVNFSFDTTTANLYYKWTFYNLDGTVSGSTTISASTASQTYNSAGTYKIKLEVTQAGCITTFEKTFTVVSCIPIKGAIKVIKPTSYPFQFSNPGNSSALACNETAFPLKFYASTQTLNIGTQLYLNEALTTVVTNGNLWYQAQANATSYKIDANGKIIEIASCSPPSTGNPSLIGFATTQITDHGTAYPNNETFNWSNAAADISLSGANLTVGDKITIEFQVRSSFTPTHYYSVQYPGNAPENFTTLSGYSLVSKDVIYDGVNNTVRVNLAIPLAKIQAANTSISGSIKLTKFNGVNATFKSGTNTLSIMIPVSGGITLTKS
jgi:hypothetical protein